MDLQLQCRDYVSDLGVGQDGVSIDYCYLDICNASLRVIENFFRRRHNFARNVWRTSTRFFSCFLVNREARHCNASFEDVNGDDDSFVRSTSCRGRRSARQAVVR